MSGNRRPFAMVLALLAILTAASCGQERPIEDYLPLYSEPELRPFADAEAFDSTLAQARARAASLRQRDRAFARATSSVGGRGSDGRANVPVCDGRNPNPLAHRMNGGGNGAPDALKLHGEHLVVLWNGVLATFDLGGGAMQLISAIRVGRVAAGEAGAQYHGLMVGDGYTLIIGESASGGHSEVARFDIQSNGSLAPAGAWQLGSPGLASPILSAHLQGDTLRLYTAICLSPSPGAGPEVLYGLRRSSASNGAAETVDVLPKDRVYQAWNGIDLYLDAVQMHTVTDCAVSERGLDCKASALLAPVSGATFVDTEAVLFWAEASVEWAPPMQVVYRLPFGQTPPTALRVCGKPRGPHAISVGPDGYLNMLLAQASLGAGRAATACGDQGNALLRVPIDMLRDGVTVAPEEAYRGLTSVVGALASGLSDAWLVYGSTRIHRWSPDRSEGESTVHVARLGEEWDLRSFAIGHQVERIEVFAERAFLIGRDGEWLHLSTLALGEDATAPAGGLSYPAHAGMPRADSELRRSGPTAPGDLGAIALSTNIGTAEGGEMAPEVPAVAFFKANEGGLEPFGQLLLEPHPPAAGCHDGCARAMGEPMPFFVGDRPFVLAADVLIEVELRSDGVRERQRVRFAGNPDGESSP